MYLNLTEITLGIILPVKGIILHAWYFKIIMRGYFKLK